MTQTKNAECLPSKLQLHFFLKHRGCIDRIKDGCGSTDVILEIIVFTDVTKRSSLAVKLLAHWVKHKFLSSFTATQCADV